MTTLLQDIAGKTIGTTTLDAFAVALMRAATDHAVSRYPHLATLRHRALSGSIAAMRALVTTCDALALPTWHAQDRAIVVRLADETAGR